MRAAAALFVALALFSTPVQADLLPPPSDATTVAEARTVRLGSTAVLTGALIDHVKGNIFIFHDETGDLRVQLSPGLWRGEIITTATGLRLTGEIERGFAGRYLWVKSVEILP